MKIAIDIKEQGSPNYNIRPSQDWNIQDVYGISSIWYDKITTFLFYYQIFSKNFYELFSWGKGKGLATCAYRGFASVAPAPFVSYACTI